MSGPIAAIICTEYSQECSGLTLGERVLTALKYSGVERVVFGPRSQPSASTLPLYPRLVGRTE